MNDSPWSVIQKKTKQQQQSNLLKSKKFVDRPIEVTMHITLYTSHGVIHCCDLADMADTDLRDELKDQGVTAVKRIGIKSKCACTHSLHSENGQWSLTVFSHALFFVYVKDWTSEIGVGFVVFYAFLLLFSGIDCGIVSALSTTGPGFGIPFPLSVIPVTYIRKLCGHPSRYLSLQSQCKDWLVPWQNTVTWFDSKFDWQLVSQHGNPCSCVSKLVLEIL